MIMDIELHVALNEQIADLFSQNMGMYGSSFDTVMYQTTKYEGTVNETITIGLGTTKGLRKTQYLFNVLEQDDCPDNVSGREPVTYYANTDLIMSYVLEVQPYSRVIRVFEVSYGVKDSPVYHLVNTVDLGKSKWLSKYIKK